MSYRKIIFSEESKIWIILGGMVLFLLNVVGLHQMMVPTILHDEMGYWTNAAYFAGYNWSGITSAFSYYSYGIGLVFSLFIRLTNDMLLVYKMVIALNVILMVLMYLMSYKICGTLFGNVPRNIKVLASVVSLCYPTYMMNIGIAWSEYYILFMVWVNLYLLVELLQKQNTWKIILFGVSLCYLYMIHQRTVGVVAVGIFIIVYLFICKKISIKNFIFFVCTIVFMLIIHKFIKNNIMQNLWSIGEAAETSNSNNDYAGRFYNMLYSFRNAGIKSLFRSILGKLYYLVVASGAVYIGSLIAGVNVIKRLINRTTDFIADIPVLYAHLVVISLFALTSIVSMEDGVSVTRTDALLYGRYIECALGPLLMIGIIEFYQGKYSLKLFSIIATAFLVLSLIVVYIYETGTFAVFLASCAGGVYQYYDLAGEYNFIFLGAKVTLCILAGIFCFFKTKKRVYIICGFLIVLILYGSNGKYLNEKSRNYVQNNNHTMIKFAEHIDNVQENVPVYCIRGNLRYAYMSLEVVQFLLPDYKMAFLPDSDAEELLEENFYLLVETVDTVNMDEYVQIDTVANGWLVMVKKNSELYTKVIERWG